MGSLLTAVLLFLALKAEAAAAGFGKRVVPNVRAPESASSRRLEVVWL